MEINETDWDEIPERCPKCNIQLSELYFPSDEDLCSGALKLAVFHCKDCKTNFAYWLPEDSFARKEGVETEPTANEPLAKTKSTKIPKKQIPRYLDAMKSCDVRSKAINRLIQTNTIKLSKAGLSLETVNLARDEVIKYLRNKSVSEKKLEQLFVASLYVKANIITSIGMFHHKGEGISERKLEEIFGVTRKTIRKWAKTFSKLR